MNTHADWPTRFITKIDIRGRDECWPWMAVKLPNGYGQFWFNGRMHNSHRMALVFSGIIIPNGFVVMHSCDNRICCNPNHLSPCRQIDNLADMKKKGRSLRGERHKLAILTESQVREIRSSTLVAPRVAEKFGVSVATIHDIRQGLSWTHIL